MAPMREPHRRSVTGAGEVMDTMIDGVDRANHRLRISWNPAPAVGTRIGRIGLID